MKTLWSYVEAVGKLALALFVDSARKGIEQQLFGIKHDGKQPNSSAQRDGDKV